jgi:hypothetical protein
VPSEEPPRIELTIRTELSRPALLALRDRIDELLDGLAADSPVTPADPEKEELAQVERETLKANASWERLSGNTRHYLAACARLASQRETFTVEDVAAESGLSHSTALALHRNVMRTSATTEPQSTRLITSHRSAGRTHLGMSKAASSRVRKLADPDQGRE